MTIDTPTPPLRYDTPTPLSAEAVRRFFDDGYVILRGVFAREEMARMRAAFERLEEAARTLRSTQMYRGAQFVVEPRADDRSGEGLCIHRVVWCGAAERELLDFGRDPRLVDPVAQLLGSRSMEQLINQAHFKLPGDDVVFEWHQDSKHRRYGTELWTDVNGRGSFVETTIAVDPMTPDNGPLLFIPGSGRGGHIAVDPVSGQLPEGSFDPADAVAVTMEPGDMALFGPYVIHGSGPNTSPHPRRLFLNGYAAPGANRRVYPGEGAGRTVEVALVGVGERS